MTDHGVTELGYVGIEVPAPELAAWRAFAAEIMGFEVVERGADTVDLRMDYWFRRLTLHAGDRDDIAYAGLRVAGPDELDAVVARLRDASIQVDECTPAEAAERRVLQLCRTTDPSGVAIELFHGPEVDYRRPFHPGRPMHGRFVTGSGGLGHLVLGQPSTEAAYRFYRLLGMRGGAEYPPQSDDPNDTPTFMHCNQRDHNIAFGMGNAPGIVHIMVEVDNLDDVGHTYGLVRSAGLPVVYHPGKHANDHMFSFYFESPSGWQFEYGFGGRPATHQTEYYPDDIFGHSTEP